MTTVDEELASLPPRGGRGVVIATELGLIRDKLGRWTVDLFEWVRHPEHGDYARRTWTQHRKATPDEVGRLPVIRDNYEEPTEQCDRCGVVDHLEEHHWAPRYLFDDYERWPTAKLCRPCHMEWHSVVTPKMAERR